MEGIILRDEPSLKLVNSSSLSFLWLLGLFFVKIPFFENIKGSLNMGNMRMSVIQTQITFPVIVLMAWLPDLLHIPDTKRKNRKLMLVYEI